MSKKSWHISRRTLLQGTGVGLALPWMETMSTYAKSVGGSGRPPLRMGIYSVTGGTVIESWKPDYEGPFQDRMPSILRSLEPHKDDVTMVSGLAHHGKTEGTNGHTRCWLLHLTGAPYGKLEKGNTTVTPSIDQVAAKAIGTRTFLPSLELSRKTEGGFAYREGGVQVPGEGNPRLAFERMFRGREPRVPTFDKRGRRAAGKDSQTESSGSSVQRGVLDLVTEQTKDLQRRLGTHDKRKLDEYLDSVRSIERRIALVEQQAQQRYLDDASGDPQVKRELQMLEPVRSSLDVGEEVRNKIGGDPEFHAQYIELMADLMVLAFETDTTRICTLMMGSDGAMFPGVVTVGYEHHAHTLEHNGNGSGADPIAREACRQIHEWYTSLFARTIEKMKNIDEGGSTLLDNTMLLYTSYMANGGHHLKDYPVLFAGNAQGTLKTGRHIAYPDGTPMSNLYVEMLHRMGVEVAEFGESKVSPHAAYGGRLPGLG